jgi:hypothetical protein
MKPGDHPEFFRFPPPEGRSRESTIRLDAEGRFWHEGRRVDHAGLAAAFHTWITRHPDDGRYILTNGYDWTYFTVDDAPYVVRAVRVEGDRAVLSLSDGTEEEWSPESSRLGEDGAVYVPVKASARGGPFDAKFSRHAQASLADLLVEGDDGGGAGGTLGGAVAGPPEGAVDGGGGGGVPAVRIGAKVHAIGAKDVQFG